MDEGEHKTVPGHKGQVLRMNSLTVRLFGLLLIATGLVWLSGIAWIYAGSRQELERVLDARLEEASRMVSSLIENADVKVSTGVSGLRIARSSSTIADRVKTEFELACQIWSIDGRLVGRSTHAPMAALTSVSSGFSEQKIGGTRWRVYAHEDSTRGLRVLIGDNVDRRERLVRGLVHGLAVPGAVVFVLLTGLIWIAIRKGLGPLHRLTEAVNSRDPDELAPIDIGHTPREISPVVNALNGLFTKVISAREHERSVTAYAAHELKTPLAGLRTQVQVALAANDPDTRDTALKNAIIAVDQTTRMARQLLALAEIEAGSGRPHREWMDAGERLHAITAELKRSGHAATLAIRSELVGFEIRINPDAFHIAARNLAENALQHSPANCTAHWTLLLDEAAFSIAIEDEGPGIPPEEIPLVTQRFYRGRNKTGIGSGLGLAIAKTALENDGLRLRLEDRSPRAGLRASIVFPLARTRRSQVTA